MGLRHTFGGIRDQITGDQGIFHTDMAHGNTVTDCDCREHNRHTARHGNAHLDCLGDLIQVHMAGNDLIIGTDNTDHRTSSLFLCITESIEQTPVGSSRDTFFDRITLHNILHIYISIYISKKTNEVKYAHRCGRQAHRTSAESVKRPLRPAA